MKRVIIVTIEKAKRAWYEILAFLTSRALVIVDRFLDRRDEIRVNRLYEFDDLPFLTSFEDMRILHEFSEYDENAIPFDEGV
jgi:hypothetical protein